MKRLAMMLILAGSASAQQLVTAQSQKCPREAESILIASCRIVGERFAIPMPSPRVELRIGDRADAVESDENVHIIHLRHWNKALFKRATVHVCMRPAELEMVPALAARVRDY
jgi:hypothetical protein